MTNSQQRIIALLTDFGPLGGHYIASMKGVILTINPKVSIIDISHFIASYSIIEASYILGTTYTHFPENCVFITVIDPGVGSSREIIAFKTNSNYYFIGPNNGIFSNVFSMEEISKCVIVNNEKYFNNPVSQTFHGRDIMAPVGAYLTNGILLERFGPQFNLKNFIKKSLPYEINLNKKTVQCSIQYIDSFGNITTNIPVENNYIKGTTLSFKDVIELELKNQKYKGKFISHFASESQQQLLFLVGSTGYLEISINQGNAAKKLSLKVGDSIIIRL